MGTNLEVLNSFDLIIATSIIMQSADDSVSVQTGMVEELYSIFQSFDDWRVRGT